MAVNLPSIYFGMQLGLQHRLRMSCEKWYHIFVSISELNNASFLIASNSDERF